MISNILEVLFPSNCRACGKQGTYICISCLSECKLPRAFDDAEDAAWMTSLFSYKDPTIKEAMWDIKFHGRFAAAGIFGPLLARAAEKKLPIELKDGAILLVPIPPSKSGKKKRGYNQTLMLAKALRRNTTLSTQIRTNILKKIRQTEKQAMLSDRTMRLQNMEGAFGVDDGSAADVRGRVMLLVDDITTTGATLREARRALLEAGARAVFAITIAH